MTAQVWTTGHDPDCFMQSHGCAAACLAALYNWLLQIHASTGNSRTRLLYSIMKSGYISAFASTGFDRLVPTLPTGQHFIGALQHLY